MTVYDLRLFDICIERLNSGKNLCLQEHDFWIFERDKVRQHINQPGARLIVHCRYLGAYLDHWKDWLDEITGFYRTTDLDSEMVFITADEFSDLQNIPKIHYLPFDCYHAYYYPIYQDFQIQDRDISKKFLCLNKRGMLHRQLLYRAFYHYDMLKDSYFSYLCEKITKYDYELFHEETWASIEQRILDTDTLRWPAMAELSVPPEKFIALPNDLGIQEYQPWTKTGNWGSDKIDPTWRTDQELLDNSFCSVIVETAPDSPVVNLSEKTFRALACGHPALILGAAGTVKRLRDMGFDMFDDVFDNSYDSVSDDIQRLGKFVDSVRKINESSLADLSALKKSLRQRRQRNHDNLRRLHSEIQPRAEEITDWVIDYFKLPSNVRDLT